MIFYCRPPRRPVPIARARIVRKVSRERGAAGGRPPARCGSGARGYFFETDLTSQQQMHQLHVLALQLTHAALTNLVARETGGVINVASAAGFGQSPGSVSYCATKTW